MPEAIVGWGVLLAVCVVGGGLIVAYVRGRAAREREEAGRRARRLEDERIAEAEENQERECAEIRRVARERARLVYADLMDKDEANGDARRDDDLDPLADRHQIRDALGLLHEQLAALRKDADIHDYKSEAYRTRVQLEMEAGILEVISQDPPNYGRPADCLTEPARIVDCGKAGNILLFTPAQVEAAREKSGFTEYQRFLDERAQAPQLARDIFERERLREEAEVAARQAARDAITTRLDELPQLPKSDVKE